MGMIYETCVMCEMVGKTTVGAFSTLFWSDFHLPPFTWPAKQWRWHTKSVSMAPRCFVLIACLTVKMATAAYQSCRTMFLSTKSGWRFMCTIRYLFLLRTNASGAIFLRENNTPLVVCFRSSRLLNRSGQARTSCRTGRRRPASLSSAIVP